MNPVLSHGCVELMKTFLSHFGKDWNKYHILGEIH